MIGSNILLGYLLSGIYPLVCLTAALIAYKLGMSVKYTRKLVHILVGFEWIILYHCFGATYHTLVICLIFLAILAITYLFKLMPMISSTSDNAPGTVYYGVSMSLMAILSLIYPDMMPAFGIAVFCTSIGDGFAGVVGQALRRFNPRIYEKKTLFGTIANFAVSTLVVLVFSQIYPAEKGVTEAVVIGAVATVAELITGNGLDNITLPLGVFSVCALINYLPGWQDYIIPIIATPLIVAFSLKKKKLTVPAVFGALVLDIAVSMAFKNTGFILISAFLVCGVIVDKIKVKRKLRMACENSDGGAVEPPKTECRGLSQIVANGFFPFVCALLYLVFKNDVWIVVYVATVCEALADTAASGFGVFSSKTYDLFKLKECENGISGGMSVVGTVSSFFASLFIALLAFGFSSFCLEYFVLSLLSGFFGAVFDSFLGSVAQVKYRCNVCGKTCESRVHCNTVTEKIGGIGFVNNDVVNYVSNAFSLAVAVLFYFLFF